MLKNLIEKANKKGKGSNLKCFVAIFFVIISMRKKNHYKVSMTFLEAVKILDSKHGHNAFKLNNSADVDHFQACGGTMNLPPKE